jgi:hypothetical protein
MPLVREPHLQLFLLCCKLEGEERERGRGKKRRREKEELPGVNRVERRGACTLRSVQSTNDTLFLSSLAVIFSKTKYKGRASNTLTHMSINLISGNEKTSF